MALVLDVTVARALYRALDIAPVVALALALAVAFALARAVALARALALVFR